MLTDFPDPKLARTLSPNGRAHWAERKRAKDVVMDRVAVAAAVQDIYHTCDPVLVTLRYVVPDRRRRDLDNATTGVAKCVLDALVRNNYLDDDDSKHVVAVVSEITYEQGVRRLEVILTPARARRPPSTEQDGEGRADG